MSQAQIHQLLPAYVTIMRRRERSAVPIITVTTSDLSRSESQVFRVLVLKPYFSSITKI